VTGRIVASVTLSTSPIYENFEARCAGWHGRSVHVASEVNMLGHELASIERINLKAGPYSSGLSQTGFHRTHGPERATLYQQC
jgi:hypothetical protein